MNDKVRKEFLNLVKGAIPIITIVATVTAVDTSELTCDVDPIDGGAAYNSVRLRSVVDGSDGGFVVIPKVGSTVLVSLIGNNDQSAFVSLVSEADEIWMKGQDYDGIVKVADLTDRLNNIENLVNNLITVFNAHVHTETATVTTPPVTTFADVLVPTTQEMIENTKVKHGSV